MSVLTDSEKLDLILAGLAGIDVEYSEDETAALLRVSTFTLRGWRRAGRIGFYRHAQQVTHGASHIAAFQQLNDARKAASAGSKRVAK